MRVPRSTYRLQIRPAFDLAAARDVLDYLHDLGAHWVYLSPLLTAEAGSDHGYDVVDHAHVDPARGGDEAFAAFARAAHERGMGVLVDIVPNHMGVAVPAHNAWWADVLRHGRGSRHAAAFDVDWAAGGGRIRIPVLGDEEDPPLALEPPGRPTELVYYDHRFPLAPGTADDGAPPSVVHDRQHYELVSWRRADAELNYRRFFAVSTLAAIRVEDPEVFERSHAAILSWIRDGLADGLRVDHPDGLLDPGGYLDRLARETRGSYVIVEKILERGEDLPPFWATAGTTGYDALAELDRVFVDASGAEALEALDAELRGGRVAWEDLVHTTKRAVADGILRSEVLRLTREIVARPPAEQGLDGLDADVLADAVAEALACFPVYRSYLPVGSEHVEAALALAHARRPDLDRALAVVRAVLEDEEHPASRRFQQTSGMVMAKGVEDTAFYRYSVLASLTEVGGDPSEFSVSPQELARRQAARLAAFPHAMTTLSTHDTKRGEDTRARISVLAEIPARWRDVLGRLRELRPLGDGPFESILWQSVVGTWPASRERLHAYAEKAAREAGTSTRWTDPDPAFEERMHAAVDAAVDDPRVRGLLDAFVLEIAPAGWSNGLGAKLLQLVGPGVPDVYQGSELWETSLVDPDNRRPMDFAERREMLASLEHGALPPVDATGAAKLLLVSRALRLRRDRPELFTRLALLPVVGEAAPHAIAVDRGGAVAVATRLPLGLAARGGWGGTAVMLPAGAYLDALTGVRVQGGERALGTVLAHYPVALLVREQG